MDACCLVRWIFQACFNYNLNFRTVKWMKTHSQFVECMSLPTVCFGKWPECVFEDIWHPNIKLEVRPFYATVSLFLDDKTRLVKICGLSFYHPFCGQWWGEVEKWSFYVLHDSWYKSLNSRKYHNTENLCNFAYNIHFQTVLHSFILVSTYLK